MRQLDPENIHNFSTKTVLQNPGVRYYFPQSEGFALAETGNEVSLRLRKVGVYLAAVLFFCGYLVTSGRSSRQGEGAPVMLSSVAASPEAEGESSPVGVPESVLAPLAAETERGFGLEFDPEAAFAPEQVTVAPTPAPEPTTSTPAESKPERKYREVWATVTAYCPCARCCGRSADGRTSLGLSAWRPGIAADPAAVPYGTEVYIEGYGLAVVDDTGGAMRRAWRRKGTIHLDVRMTYHYEARQWGQKVMKVKIYE